MLWTPTNARKKFPMAINNKRGTALHGSRAATYTVSVTKAPFTIKCRDSLANLAQQHPPSQVPGIMTMSH